MTYVALLRGINVGGKNKVEMARLRRLFEGLGHDDVRTYINSGNVIFEPGDSNRDPTGPISNAIEAEFGFPVAVLVRDLQTVERVETAIPDHWKTDKTMRCDIMFLWDEINDPSILDQLPVRDGIDNVVYVDGAVIWQVDAANLTRSGRSRIVGGQLYKSCTVRNANTVRKIAQMMRDSDD